MKKEGTDAALPHRRTVPRVAQPEIFAAPPLAVEAPPTANQSPVAVVSPDPTQESGEFVASELATTRSKVTFQWPPDCLWPFLDRGYDPDR
jgi:hypothetical protein